jgi:hypothetical protein
VDTDSIRCNICIRVKFGYPDPNPDLQIEYEYIHFTFHITNKYEYQYEYLYTYTFKRIRISDNSDIRRSSKPAGTTADASIFVYPPCGSADYSISLFKCQHMNWKVKRRFPNPEEELLAQCTVNRRYTRRIGAGRLLLFSRIITVTENPEDPMDHLRP